MSARTGFCFLASVIVLLATFLAPAARAQSPSISLTRYSIAGDFNSAAFVYASDVGRDGDADVLGAARVADEIAWWVLEGAFSSEPVITGITPHSGPNTGVVHISDLTGSGFQSGAAVKLTRTGRMDINASDAVVVSASRITCDLDLRGAAPGQWTVRVTNPDSQFAELVNGFTVHGFVYLPLVIRNGSLPPPSPPTLYEIHNSDGDGTYTVTWSAVSGVSSYTLQEDDNGTFSSPTVVYSGSSTSKNIAGKGEGTYYYRVKASTQAGDSGWSNVESVTVLPPEKPTRGNWTGQRNAFAVAADNGYVCSFAMSWSDSPACGVLSSYSFPCTPIDASDHFTYDASYYGTSITYEGDFTSATTASGTWIVQRGTCTSDGTWSASPDTEGSFNCNRDSDVEICAWVNMPNPIEGLPVIVYGQLLVAGVGQDGLPMHVEWHFETTTETCDGETGADGSGLARCSVPTGQARAGYTVMIDVTITYNGHIYTASTWFTPQERPSRAQMKPVASAKR